MRKNCCPFPSRNQTISAPAFGFYDASSQSRFGRKKCPCYPEEVLMPNVRLVHPIDLPTHLASSFHQPYQSPRPAMKNPTHTLRLLTIASSALLLASCELPPRAAWRIIQHDGLVPYLAIEWGKKPVPSYALRPAAPRATSLSAKAPVAVAVTRPAPPCCLPVVASNEHRNWSAGNSYLDTTRTAVSTPLASSSVISSPRAARPGVYVIPAPKVTTAHPLSVIRAKPPAPKPAPTLRIPVTAPKEKPVTARVAKKEPAPAPKPTPAPQPPAPAKSEVASAPVAKPSPESKPPSTASTAQTPAPTPAPTPAKANSPAGLPFASTVPGRPGLVNSPYAGKYQLVDVTGLAPGQEVKCPYSGKLFKVPATIQATNNVKIPTEPPLATPPKK